MGGCRPKHTHTHKTHTEEEELNKLARAYTQGGHLSKCELTDSRARIDIAKKEHGCGVLQRPCGSETF